VLPHRSPKPGGVSRVFKVRKCADGEAVTTVKNANDYITLRENTPGNARNYAILRLVTVTRGRGRVPHGNNREYPENQTLKVRVNAGGCA
jgi:hypothetical protein